jgi:signal recognition particle GTPase
MDNLNKLDEYTRWSGTDKTIVNKPIKFVGTGEKWMQLMCSIIRMAESLGMGDVVSW